MIERVLVKDYLSFENIELNFSDKLIAFTGSSGAGKSIFMEALLTVFGLKDADAKMVEVSINLPLPILNKFGISEEEPNVLKFIKEKKARYFINSQAVSKKNMQEICSVFIRYLSLRDDDEFSSKSMIELLDNFIIINNETYKDILLNFQALHVKYLHVKQKLQKIIKEEEQITQLKEFARYEIETIDKVNPKSGEDEELLEIKKNLSKKEKISQALQKANGIFEFENAVFDMLNLCEINSDFFNDCMNELRALIDENAQKIEQLDELDIENLLSRIEEISKLKIRFGSIDEIIKHKLKKQEELKRYENISFEKSSLEKEFEDLEKEIFKNANILDQKRMEFLPKLEFKINDYLKKLYLNNSSLTLTKTEISEQGINALEVKLNNTDIKKVSSGELNRIRLAFISTKNDIEAKGEKGILILDEVDANLSGKEAMSVANVLKEISSSYQVLAISHQPQLSSRANCHFLVEKKQNKSTIKLLDKKNRIIELARMISGEEIKSQALDFAEKLLEN